MDKTVTRRATWTRFLIAGARRMAPWRLALLPVAGLLAIGHPLRLIDRAGLKRATQLVMLGRRIGAADMDELVDAFAEAIDRDEVMAAARARIADDRAAGYRLVLATAQLEFDAVIATAPKRDAAGDVLCGVAGDNCYGPAKRRMVEAWLLGEGIDRAGAHIRFYSDHVSDAPMLELADEPFAVNPHPPLRRLAAARGWPVLDWD